MDESTSTPKLENRAIIKFCYDLGKTPPQNLDMMKQAGCSGIQRSLVFRWHKMFKDGMEEVHDEHRTGRRKSKVTLIDTVRDVVYADRRVMVRDICDLTSIPYGKVYRILVELHVRRLYARWIPKI